MMICKYTIMICVGAILVGCSSDLHNGEEITTIESVSSGDASSRRYSIAGSEYTAEKALEVVNDRLRQTDKKHQIVVVFRDKRSGRDDGEFLAELTRLAKPFGARIEIKWPRSSYDGNTRLVPQ